MTLVSCYKTAYSTFWASSIDFSRFYLGELISDYVPVCNKRENYERDKYETKLAAKMTSAIRQHGTHKRQTERLASLSRGIAS